MFELTKKRFEKQMAFVAKHAAALQEARLIRFNLSYDGDNIGDYPADLFEQASPSLKRKYHEAEILIRVSPDGAEEVLRGATALMDLGLRGVTDTFMQREPLRFDCAKFERNCREAALKAYQTGIPHYATYTKSGKYGDMYLTGEYRQLVSDGTKEDYFFFVFWPNTEYSPLIVSGVFQDTLPVCTPIHILDLVEEWKAKGSAEFLPFGGKSVQRFIYDKQPVELRQGSMVAAYTAKAASLLTPQALAQPKETLWWQVVEQKAAAKREEIAATHREIRAMLGDPS